jgi:membrane-associated phospholipid phosphatase
MVRSLRTASFIILVTLFLVSSQTSAQNLDIRILRSLNSPERLPSDRFFQFASNSDGFLVFGVPVVIGSVGMIRHDEQLTRNAIVALAAVSINSGITLALKYSVNRTRPFITYPDITKKSAAGSPSFPSGHTSSSFALATSLSLSYPKWYIIVPLYSWAGTVAFSRMDLGVHYPSDVVAGAVIGAGSAWLTYYVNKKLILKSQNKPRN